MKSKKINELRIKYMDEAYDFIRHINKLMEELIEIQKHPMNEEALIKRTSKFLHKDVMSLLIQSTLFSDSFFIEIDKKLRKIKKQRQ